MFKKLNFGTFLCTTSMILLGYSQASAQDNVTGELSPVIVKTTEENGGLTVPSNEDAKKAIEQTPGGVAVVPAENYENTYSLNFEDTLAYVPGVYAQKRFGEEVRISIRGSGLSRGFHLRGLDLLQDGIPYNLADGASDFQEADSLALQRLEVFKGANSLQHGGSTLGGAVNMVTKTGRSDQGDQIRTEIGSYSTQRVNAQSGRVFGDSDMFLSLTGTNSAGFRTHSEQENIKFNGNYGTELTDNAETRFYFSSNFIEQELPGSVSKTVALNAPKTAASTSISGDQRRDIRSARLSNKTTFDLSGGDVVDVGAFVNLKDLFHPISIVVDQESIDYGVFAQRSGDYTLAGHNNRYRVGATTHSGQVDAKVYVNSNGSRGALTSSSVQTSNNAKLYGENDFFITPEVALVTGAQLSWSERDDENQLTPSESADKTYEAFNPKVGVLYEPNKDTQFFANVSKSHEPPTFSELTQSGTVGFTPVDPQKGWTLEVGSRGKQGIARWDASVYRAWLRDEMLQYTTGSGIPASTFNAGDTIHQGVELGLDLELANNIATNGDHLQLRNAYTYSDYYFVNDPQFGDNTIAGQPPHFYQAELRYDHPEGWYVAPNLELASGSYVDFANSLRAPGYGLVGIGAGHEVDKNITLFLDGRNLLDKNYISTYSTIVNTSGSTSVFYPGEGRIFYAGIRIKL